MSWHSKQVSFMFDWSVCSNGEKSTGVYLVWFEWRYLFCSNSGLRWPRLGRRPVLWSFTCLYTKTNKTKFIDDLKTVVWHYLRPVILIPFIYIDPIGDESRWFKFQLALTWRCFFLLKLTIFNKTSLYQHCNKKIREIYGTSPGTL